MWQLTILPIAASYFPVIPGAWITTQTVRMWGDTSGNDDPVKWWSWWVDLMHHRVLCDSKHFSHLVRRRLGNRWTCPECHLRSVVCSVPSLKRGWAIFLPSHCHLTDPLRWFGHRGQDTFFIKRSSSSLVSSRTAKGKLRACKAPGLWVSDTWSVVLPGSLPWASTNTVGWVLITSCSEIDAMSNMARFTWIKFMIPRVRRPSKLKIRWAPQ